MAAVAALAVARRHQPAQLVALAGLAGARPELSAVVAALAGREPLHRPLVFCSRQTMEPTEPLVTRRMPALVAVVVVVCATHRQRMVPTQRAATVVMVASLVVAAVAVAQRQRQPPECRPQRRALAEPAQTQWLWRLGTGKRSVRWCAGARGPILVLNRVSHYQH